METFIGQYREYLLKEKHFSLHTVNAYVKDVERFWESAGSDVAAADAVRYGHIRKWMVRMSSEGLENSSINRKVASLKSYFRFLYITKTIEVYPLEGHKSLRIQKKLQVPFSEDEMKAIERSHFKEGYFGFQEYVIILLFYALGIRKSELIGIKCNDVDLDRNEVKIFGKRSKERVVPLVSGVSDVLTVFVKERQLQFGYVSNQNLFLLKNGQNLNQTFVYHLINNYFRGITSKDKKSPHVLRHTFATHMLNAGANLNTIKELLGHASLSSTQIYTHTSLAELKKVYSRSHPRFNSDDEDL